MRRGTQDVGLITNDLGIEVIGVNLGWDFVAEHEWGIKKLRAALGIPEVPVGYMERRINPRTDVVFQDRNEGREAVLFYSPAWGGRKQDGFKDFPELREAPRTYDGIVGAWCDGDFGVHATTPESVAALRMVYAAFQAGNCVLTYGGSNTPFGNSGLCLVDITKISNTYLHERIEADHLGIKLAKLTKKTQDEVEQAWKDVGGHVWLAGHPTNKPWFALVTKSFAEDGEEQTFLLNPSDQKIFAFGYYTLEQLLAWPKGEGPIWANK